MKRVLSADPRVRLGYLYGSAARGEDGPKSDLDVAVWLVPSPSPDDEARLLEALEVAAGRTVDLVLLDEAPPLLAREVLADGIVLVCRDDDERAEFELRLRALYLDTNHLREVQRHYLRERVGKR